MCSRKKRTETHLRIFHILFKCMINIQHRQMITVNMSEAHLGFVGSLFGFQWPHEDLWDCIQKLRKKWEETKKEKNGSGAPHFSRRPKNGKPARPAFMFSSVHLSIGYNRTAYRFYSDSGFQRKPTNQLISRFCHEG